MSSVTNNKRIAKNSLLLYLRMFITMAVGLYTSRVVLNVLGISDYGLYNVVGGIVTMSAFLNVAMAQASQRFIAYELGQGDTSRLGKVFSMAVNIHLSICVIVFLLAETIGLWFVNEKLNLPTDRMIAANWVFQSSIITFCLNVSNVPYNAAIVAHEKMSAFAYISIVDSVLKLLIVYLLLVIPFDKLIVYSVLTVLVSVGIRLFYTIYCKRNFPECTYHKVTEKTLFKEMFSFAGWSVLGNVGGPFKDQIINIILNILHGTTVNAARGIAVHVATIINTFVTNFTMAINPQITKQYAVGNTGESRKLVYAGCKYSFYLLMIIAIPLIIKMDYILKLWLGIVPEYTSQFIILAIMTALIYSMSSCVTTAIQATGRVKWFQIGICVIMLCELPVAYILLKWGFPPYSVMWPSIISFILALLYRFWLIKSYVNGYALADYIINIVLRCVAVFSVGYTANVFLFKYCHDNIIEMIAFTMFSVIVSSTSIFILGLGKAERSIVIKKASSVFK